MIGGHGLVVLAPGRPWDFGVLRALQTGSCGNSGSALQPGKLSASQGVKTALGE